tara:strand:+ start:1257 stop:1631 length:375 start_codon:yes stop_codon:yes gene_type:complete
LIALSGVSIDVGSIGSSTTGSFIIGASTIGSSITVVSSTGVSFNGVTPVDKFPFKSVATGEFHSTGKGSIFSILSTSASKTVFGSSAILFYYMIYYTSILIFWSICCSFIQGIIFGLNSGSLNS